MASSSRTAGLEHSLATLDRPHLAYSVEKLDGFDALLGLGFDEGTRWSR